jgi:hypothetical protein
LEVLWGFERERWDDYMQYYEEAINNTSTDYAPWYVILPTIKKCAVILWVKSFGKKCRNTLIFKRLKWMRKLKKHRIVQRDVGKE